MILRAFMNALLGRVRITVICFVLETSGIRIEPWPFSILTARADVSDPSCCQNELFKAKDTSAFALSANNVD